LKKPGQVGHRKGQQMNTLRKKIQASFLIIGIAFGVMFGSAQQSKAAYYDNYYQYYQNNINAYNSTGNPFYYYTARAFLYYYYSGYYGDRYAFTYDPYGDYSDRHMSSSYYSSYSYHDIYYNYYAWYGDYYYRLYHNVPNR
jgi:hypothetical protein